MTSKHLHEGHLYWPSTMQQPASTYPPLAQTVQADVAIIGGGMSGSICAYILSRSGLTTVLLERGNIAAGSSLANTGLLQYCNDTMLCDLAEQIGEGEAVRFYKGCKLAVEQIGELAAELGTDTGYAEQSSLYYASTEQDVPKLKREYELLKRHQFGVEYLEPEEVEARFPFRRSGAVITHGDASINPYRFVHGLIDAAVYRFGLAVHEQTDLTDHRSDPGSGGHKLVTSAGHEVLAKHVIYAVGYEPEELRGKLVKSEMNRTYALVTDPQPELHDNYSPYMFWETARPYFYMRFTEDKRIIAGGGDVPTKQLLTSESALKKEADKVLANIQALFSSTPVAVDYAWNATFALSRDGLPFIGADPNWDGVFYCLGYGGNGTVYSMMGAHILHHLITGRDHPLASIVALDRPSLQKV
ncbi:NAD(P)/FAD-dependent oxidoreductase [Paenibacillus albus]|uniref:FAD-binding oxidoreductase n=1 Tax=Paenibacillus albus TaxID=2495582 RepID=A0A3Q8X4Q4_9BACL|nr:FAD-dependent oxidoreductase [Paenibacillus albus]AZN40016.1 FAD-binding oxidoreductase [Paenibacillus albus]